MTLHRVHKTDSYYETINIWEGEADTGKYVTTVNGLNMAGTTRDYPICVNAAVHTLALSEYNNNGWTQGSYMDILMGGYYTDYTSGGRLGWRFMSVYAYYWTATQDSGKGDGYYFARKFGYNQNGIWRHSMEKDHYQLSVRFVRDVE